MTGNRSGPGRAAVRRALPLLTLLAIGAQAARAQELRWTGTTSFSQGSYVFDATTRTAALYTGLGLAWGRVDVSASLPLVVQNSQLVSQVAGVSLPTGGSDHEVVGRRQPGQTVGTGRQGMGSGGGSTSEVTYRDSYSLAVGDPFVSAGVRLLEDLGALRSLEVRGSAKPPLRALDSGVGTGEWDAGLGASAIASVGRAYVFVDGSYWWYGDLPELALADGLGYGAGLSVPIFGARGSVLATFFGSEAVVESMERPASLGLGLGYAPRLGRSYSGGVTVGLSEASPDFSVYAGWTWGL